jgi:cytochrome c-type biogenesis protein CcmH
MRRVVATACTLAVAALALASAAAASCPQTTLADIEDEVMCPVCGVPLGLAEAPQAERERVFVKRLINRCKSKREIETALVAEFGPRVLALPEKKGFSLAAYLVPALAIIAAGAGIAVAMARWKRERRRPATTDAAVADAPLDPGDLARLDAELEGGGH